MAERASSRKFGHGERHGSILCDDKQFTTEKLSSRHPLHGFFLSLSPPPLSQNGFWLALGWCAIFFIPVAIFAIITSQYYRRMKYDEDVAIPYDDSFP